MYTISQLPNGAAKPWHRSAEWWKSSIITLSLCPWHKPEIFYIFYAYFSLAIRKTIKDPLQRKIFWLMTNMYDESLSMRLYVHYTLFDETISTQVCCLTLIQSRVLLSRSAVILLLNSDLKMRVYAADLR